jgi:hypothetical protein
MITLPEGVVRLDDAEAEVLLAGSLDGAALQEFDQLGLAPALETLRNPLITLEVLVAGDAVQHHRVAVDIDRAVLLLAVRPGLNQLMVLPPAHLAAALTRITRIGPRRHAAAGSQQVPTQFASALLDSGADVRRVALDEVGANVVWRLRVDRPEGQHDLIVVDGPSGIRVLDDEQHVVLPTSATTLYRVFATALPA